MQPVLTITTDFGLEDHYVSSLKAIILNIAPEVRLVDISNQIPPHDVMAGAWVVKNAAFKFPKGTIHLVIINPGILTDINPVIVCVSGHYFVGPDNGVFSLIAEESQYDAVKLTNRKFWYDKKSGKHHSIDIFAPVAAHLASGVEVQKFGEKLEKIVKYRCAVPIVDRDGIQGWVVHIDHFGNLVTNISDEMLAGSLGNRDFRIYVGNTILKGLSESYGSVPDGEPVAYIGSSGMLEIAVNKANANKLLGVEKGAQVSIVLQK